MLPAILAASSLEPLYFEPNRGQAAETVAYVARSGGDTFLIQGRDLILRSAGHSDFIMAWDGPEAERGVWKASEPRPGSTSYYLGALKGRSIADVPHYARITHRNVYPGVDITIYGNQGQLEYDLELA